MIPQILAYVPEVSIFQIAPFAILLIAGLLVLAIDALYDLVVKGGSPAKRDGLLMLVTFASLLACAFSFATPLIQPTAGRPFLEGILRADEFGHLGALIILFGALVVTVLSPRLIETRRLPAGEWYALLVFSVMGMTLLTLANEMITAFICIEIMSLALYVMAGIDRRSKRAGEAAFKYFILGAFASAFLVMGVAFLYGATGTTQLFSDKRIADPMRVEVLAKGYTELPSGVHTYDIGIAEVLLAEERLALGTNPQTVSEGGTLVSKLVPVRTREPLNPVWIFMGFALVFVGLCFKLSLAPFHMWAPDVYEGAPTLTAMFIATASKVATFAFLIHLIEAMSSWRSFPAASGFLLSAVAVISMLWGNLGALVQTNIKRMLAYSSIAHGGYMAVGAATLVAPMVFADSGRTFEIRNAIILYLFAYTVMNIIAFGIASYLGKEGETDIANYRGLAQRRPWLAAGMALAMISLVGVPPTVGFWGKFYIFKEAIDAGLVGVAVIAMIASAISAYYYLRVVVAMYMQEAPEGEVAAGGVLVASNGYRFVLALSAGLIFLFGLMPALIFALGTGK